MNLRRLGQAWCFEVEEEEEEEGKEIKSTIFS
jgi:hypothetical protein